ncbi:hypothetical protein NL676_033080 [Syzygium grande]|nr:hypothetical protein NL676_033080 [Syzygium grande]
MWPKVSGEPIKPPPYGRKRMPSSDRVIDIGGPSNPKRQTRLRTVQISPSQASIDTTESPCTEESGIDGDGEVVDRKILVDVQCLLLDEDV